MDYSFMDYILNSAVVEDMETKQIIYMNHTVKSFLKIPEQIGELYVYDFFENKETFEKIAQKATRALKIYGAYEDVIEIKNYEGILLKVNCQCNYIGEQKKHLCYIFQSIYEILDGGQMSFHSLTELLPNAIALFTIDPTFHMVYGNQGAYDLFELEREADKELFHNNIKETIYEEDRGWFLSQIREYILKEENICIEFRIKTTKGLKWVDFRGNVKKASSGIDLIYANMSDITSRKEMNDKIHMEKVFLHKFSELSNEILFRYDVKRDSIHILGKPVATLPIEPTIRNFSKKYSMHHALYEEDKNVLNELLENVRHGVVEPKDVRFVLEDGTIEWFQVIYDFVKNDEGETILVIGKICDIQERKALEKKAKLDLLTQCYNKITTAIEIQELLLQERTPKNTLATEGHTLFIVDIDNFKAINDNLGHHFGDLVLCEVANSLRDCFRKQDIVGRIGGDEFVVFVEDCNNPLIIAEKATKIGVALRKTYYGEDDFYSISASIGIASYPKDGLNYEELYQAADKALYESKKQGKNCYTMYHNELVEDMMGVSPIIRRGVHNHMGDTHIVMTVFNLLYETNDMKTSLEVVLQHIGIRFDVDRCYIFESFEEKAPYHNIYEWCRGRADSRKNVQMIQYETVQYLFRNIDENHMVTTTTQDVLDQPEIHTIMKEQEVETVLMVKSKEREHLRAFFGMDDCSEVRQWSKMDLQTIYYISRIIFTFLEKYNAKTSKKSS